MNPLICFAVTALIWAVSLWLLLRDMQTEAWKELEGPKLKRQALIYSAVMLLLALGMVLMFRRVYPSTSLWTALKRLALLALIWPVAFTDLKTLRIPNSFILLGLGCRALLLPFELLFGEPGVWQVLLTELIAAGALLLAAVLCALVVKNSIGFGDMKLFAVMGLLLGTQGIFGPILLSLIVSFVIALVALVTKRKTRKDVIPFGPALVIGTYLALYLTGM